MGQKDDMDGELIAYKNMIVLMVQKTPIRLYRACWRGMDESLGVTADIDKAKTFPAGNMNGCNP